jgi:hypothetical protein
LKLRVRGLGLGMLGLRFGVSDLGLGDSDLRFWVEGRWLGVKGLKGADLYPREVI